MTVGEGENIESRIKEKTQSFKFLILSSIFRVSDDLLFGLTQKKGSQIKFGNAQNRHVQKRLHALVGEEKENHIGDRAQAQELEGFA